MSVVSNLSDVLNKKRAAIYTRYSCDMSRPQSLEDQERGCREYAETQGWIVLDDFVRSDAAMTGRKLKNRIALESLIADAQLKPRPFDVLIVDELSRLARKLKDVLSMAEILRHFGVKIYVLAQKLDSDDQNFGTLITMYGMMDEQNSAHMRHRVLRGQEGRIRDGFLTGSRCFGYRGMPVQNMERPDLQGRAGLKGVKWEVIESEAATIRRIYELFANGHSAYQICLKLNEENVPAVRKARIGPFGTLTW